MVRATGLAPAPVIGVTWPGLVGVVFARIFADLFIQAAIDYEGGRPPRPEAAPGLRAGPSRHRPRSLSLVQPGGSFGNPRQSGSAIVVVRVAIGLSSAWLFCHCLGER